MGDFTELIDLASERFGAAVLAANDEFFAPKESLLRASKPVWREGEYTERGKWMDGWETRRRRTPGHDWCVIRLGLPGHVQGVLVDTSFFVGNFPESCSLEGCEVAGTPGPDDLLGEGPTWFPILDRSPLRGNSENLFPVAATRRTTHLRFSIFPDGGVARLRVFGEAAPEPTRFAAARAEVDLAAAENGALVVATSDAFFGSRHNLIMPGRATHMGDGWETRRRRGPGHDWAVVRLAARGVVHRVEVDTDHFKGNAPESCSIAACSAARAATVTDLDAASVSWSELLPRTKLQPHTRHRFEQEINAIGPVTHARLSIFPDGGVARLRLFGSIQRDAPS